jgi:enamine deaminase RidA (YjgF/YER057c/UK114 family)
MPGAREETMVQRISTGSPFEATFGYSRAVRHGDSVYVSGTTGYDYASMIMPESVGEQAGNALKTISKALRNAGSDISDVVRVVYYVGDRSYVNDVVAAVGPVFKDIRPAASMLIVQMIEPGMKIEIEVTARIGAARS